MNTEYRYQLESKRLTGHQPRKIACPHCGKKKCFVRYVDTKNSFDYVADRDEPGERLFLQLREVLPSLVHHQLPPDCKDFSDYYV